MAMSPFAGERELRGKASPAAFPRSPAPGGLCVMRAGDRVHLGAAFVRAGSYLSASEREALCVKLLQRQAERLERFAHSGSERRWPAHEHVAVVDVGDVLPQGARGERFPVIAEEVHDPRATAARDPVELLTE